MTINNSVPLSNENQPTDESPLACTQCRTRDYLILESVESTAPKVRGKVAVQYSCGNCESFYAHDVSVEEIALVLHTQPVSADIVNFGNTYIHCGEPMVKRELRIAGIQADIEDLADAPVVQVESAVLRCLCGFQMAIPNETEQFGR